MSFLRRLWDEASAVNENEPQIAELIAALAVFALMLIAFYLWTLVLWAGSL